MMSLPDMQSTSDARGVSIDQVGIAGLRQPVVFDDGTTRQSGIAEIEMTVALPADVRGTHMSRMVRVIADDFQVFDPFDLPRVMKLATDRLAEDITMSVGMAFASQVAAPVSQIRDWQVHDLHIVGTLASGIATVDTTVTTDVTSLCPCSRAVSDYGAHNQRSRVSVTVRGEGDQVYPVKVSELADLIRSAGSCPVYPFVRRPDERAVTMLAYDNPVFVEDIVRELAVACEGRGVAYRIEARNLESIHSHDAIARIDRLATHARK